MILYYISEDLTWYLDFDKRQSYSCLLGVVIISILHMQIVSRIYSKPNSTVMTSYVYPMGHKSQLESQFVLMNTDSL
jgi:hypothetical protein